MKKFFKDLCKTVALFAAISATSVMAPQLHNDYLRWEVGESVVKVMNLEQTGGGTGFAIRGASGKNYIMTNKHVCEVATGYKLIIKTDEGKSKIKKVIYKDSKHDLCLIEGDESLSPLKLGSSPKKGDLHFAVGHPGLRPLTISQGEYIGNDTVDLLDDVMLREQCTGKVIELSPMQQFFYGREFACLKSYKAFMTTATIYGGNSGSPVVNQFGNVIAVVFAGSTSEEKDNYLVPFKDVERVLSKF